MANTLKLGAGKWATGTDTVLAFNDENNNFKPLPFDFSRASSATVVNQSGLIETVGSGEPRIDFKDNTKGALLLEPTRTNAITNSETFGSTGWSGFSSGSAITTIVTNNYAISPDGTQNAQRIQFNLGGGTTASDRAAIRQSIGTQTDWFLSVYMKSTNGTDQNILWHTGGDGSQTTVTGEWKRYTLNVNSIANSWAGLSLRGGISNVNTADILVYGFQAEQGSYPTSIISTSGSAVTRVADSCSQTAPDGVIGQTEGTVFVEFNVSSIESAGVYAGFRIFDGTDANKLEFIYYPDGRLQAVAFVGGALVANINLASYGLTTGVHKFAFAYKLNDYVLYVDGVNVGVDTSASVPATSQFDLFRTNGGLLNYNNVLLYNTRLSNAELQALTTI